MTTSVIVKARAWGALVTIAAADQDEITTTLGAHQDRQFDIAEGETITVRQGDAPISEEEPAKADELIRAPTEEKAPERHTTFGGRPKAGKESDD